MTYWAGVLRGAKSRGIVCHLSIEEAWRIFLEQNKRCNLSGLPIGFSRKRGETTASLDRIDSSSGYELGNVQWIHKDINLMKMHLNQKYFLNLCGLCFKKIDTSSTP
jgi:hypothetical protein